MPPSSDHDHSLRAVLALATPIGLAFIPLGMALGLLVVHEGLAWWWAPLFAVVIYAGSL
jgi:predicted branched-subunit amino acid permease